MGRKRKTVLVVASDFLQSEIARRLATGLVAARFEAVLFTGNGQDEFSSGTDLEGEARRASAVVVTVSDRSDKEVRAASLASNYNVPIFAVCGGGYGSWKKSEFRSVLKKATALFVTDEAEAVQARVYFPNVKVVATGCPVWEDFGKPKFTRRETRAYLGIKSGEKLLLVVGEKSPILNLTLVAAVIEAVKSGRFVGKKIRIMVALHPGDQSSDVVYEDIPSYASGVAIEVRRRPVPPPADWRSTSDMLPGVDAVVATNSTVLIQAAMLGVPSIACLLRGAFRGITLPVRYDPQLWWPPAAREGAIEPVFGVDSFRLASLLHEMLFVPGGFALRRAAQKKYFPLQRKGYAVGLMVEAIKGGVKVVG